MDGSTIVPSSEELEARMAQQQAMMQQAAGGGPGQPGQPPGPAGPGGAHPARALDNAQRTRSPEAMSRQGGG